MDKKITCLQKTYTRSQLASLLKYNFKKFTEIIYANDGVNNKYKSFTISKKNGSERTINAPNEDLKELQEKLAELLQKCYSEIHHDQKNNPKKYLKRVAHGFIKGSSIITNAYHHKNKRYVFNIDLKDFFQSIHFGRVSGFLQKNKNWQLSKEVSNTIANIACYQKILPQGSPCSPIITNILTSSLDKELLYFAKNNKCDYTRYADDITFSTNIVNFPINIASQNNDDKWSVSNELKTIIENHGFNINNDKTRMSYKTSRQEVTGLVVNKKVNVSRIYIRNTRAMLYQWIKQGGGKTPLSRNELMGRLAFIFQVRNRNMMKFYNDKNINTFSHDDKNIKKDVSIILIKKFIYADKFLFSELPFVIGEGKTDGIYLKAVLKIFHKQGKYKDLNFNVAKYSDTYVHVMGQGDSNLKELFINKKQFKDFVKHENFNDPKCLKPINPVIIIFDRDNVDTIKTIKNDEGKDWAFKDPNFYAFCIPKLLGKEELCIEHYFSEDFINTPIKFKGTERSINVTRVKKDKKSKEKTFKIDENNGGISKIGIATHITKLSSQYKEKIKNGSKIPDDKIEEYISNFETIIDIINEITKDYKSK